MIKCTGGSTSRLLQHQKSKHSIQKPSSTQSDVSAYTQSASSTKRFKSAYSQATLHSFTNKKTREEIVAKLVAVDAFPPSAVCMSEFICQAFSDKSMPFQEIRIMYVCNVKLQKMLLRWRCNNL